MSNEQKSQDQLDEALKEHGGGDKSKGGGRETDTSLSFQKGVPLDWLPSQLVLSQTNAPSLVTLDWKPPASWKRAKELSEQWNVPALAMNPNASGVYAFFEYPDPPRKPLVWYIGESISIRQHRFQDDYLKGQASNEFWKHVLKEREDHLYYTYAEAPNREAGLINAFGPKWNGTSLNYNSDSGVHQMALHDNVAWYAAPMVPRGVDQKDAAQACREWINQRVPQEDGFYVLLGHNPTQAATRNFMGRSRLIEQTVQRVKSMNTTAYYVGKAQRKSGLQARLLEHLEGRADTAAKMQEFYRNLPRPIDLTRDPHLVALYIRETTAEKSLYNSLVEKGLRPRTNIQYSKQSTQGKAEIDIRMGRVRPCPRQGTGWPHNDHDGPTPGPKE
jgi:hypothetical protein